MFNGSPNCWIKYQLLSSSLPSVGVTVGWQGWPMETGCRRNHKGFTPVAIPPHSPVGKGERNFAQTPGIEKERADDSQRYLLP